MTMNRHPDSLARFPLMFALVAFACIAPVALQQTGCATGKGQLTPSTGHYDPEAVASTLVVTAENVRAVALDAFDNFMRLERQHQDLLLKANPRIHAVAEAVRRDGRKALNSLTAAKVAFQNNRTTANATALTNAMAAVQSLLKDAIKHTTEIASRFSPPPK